jgi:L-aminopeptidase/D-esterase-like protein
LQKGKYVKTENISITDIAGFRLGNAHDTAGATGCSVVICESGAVCGADVRGGGPATRETDLLSPDRKIDRVHAVLLSGGSAFGLDAAAGVMAYLEERGIGYDTFAGKVPIVCGASLFDLIVGDPKARPDKAMGYAACENAFANPSSFANGNAGAGMGATVGKYLGAVRMMKCGLGFHAVRIGSVEVGAVAAVNAVGDVYDPQTGALIAGLLVEGGKSISGTPVEMLSNIEKGRDVLGRGGSPSKGDGGVSENTTLVCVLTNAILSKAEAHRVAVLSHDGMARAIKPVHTSVDGDAAFSMASGKVKADADAVACLAADVTAEAIKDAALSAKSAYGLKAAADLK